MQCIIVGHVIQSAAYTETERLWLLKGEHMKQTEGMMRSLQHEYKISKCVMGGRKQNIVRNNTTQCIIKQAQDFIRFWLIRVGCKMKSNATNQR